MATRGGDSASRESALSQLAHVLRELVVEGGVKVVTYPEAGATKPVFSTLIQLDGDVVVSVARAHVEDAELWARHLREVAQRLEPLEDLQRWMEAVRRHATWVAVLGSVGSLGLLLSRGEALEQWALTVLPAVLGGIARYALPPLAVHLIHGWVVWRLKRLPAVEEGPPRTP